MSFQQGSFSITRYRVLGRESRLSVADLNRNLPSYQAGPITLKRSPKELDFGWVLPENPELDDPEERQFNWDISDCLFEEGILLKFRMERKTVPSQLYQAIAKQRWQESRKQDQGGDDPQRVQKKHILEEVKEELLGAALPSISYVEAFWKDQEDTILLFSQSKKARECFETLFRNTFGQPLDLGLFPIVPPLNSLSPKDWANLGSRKDLLQSINRIIPDIGRQPQFTDDKFSISL